MQERIEISLEYQNSQMDLQIPTRISFARLNELMHAMLEKSAVPFEWQLVVKDKDFEMASTDLIQDLPIGSGDVFCIVPLTEN